MVTGRKKYQPYNKIIMIDKFLKAKSYAILLLFSLTGMANSESFDSYDELSADERKELFANKSRLPEDDPNKLVTLLTYGINDQNNDVSLEALRMSILTISGVESRAQADDPVAIDKAVYEKFLRSFAKLRNHPDPVVQSTLEETKILDEAVFKELANKRNQQAPINANQEAPNSAVRVPSDKKFDDPVEGEIQRSPDANSPVTQDSAPAPTRELSRSEKKSNLPWIIAGVLLAGILLLLFKTFKGNSTS